MVVWADTNKYIVENQEDRAEECKKKVEADQRQRNEARKQSGQEYVPKMFQKTDSGWTFKDAGPYKGKGEAKEEDSDDELPVFAKCVLAILCLTRFSSFLSPSPATSAS